MEKKGKKREIKAKEKERVKEEKTNKTSDLK
jgi:hypothetical protein